MPPTSDPKPSAPTPTAGGLHAHPSLPSICLLHQLLLSCLRGPACPSPPFTRPGDRGMGLVLLPPQNHSSTTWNSPSFRLCCSPWSAPSGWSVGHRPLPSPPPLLLQLWPGLWLCLRSPKSLPLPLQPLPHQPASLQHFPNGIYKELWEYLSDYFIPTNSYLF